MSSPTFSEAMRALTGPQLIAVRDQIRAWCSERYEAGLRDGKRQCLSSIWQLDPDSAEVAQMITEMLPPLPPVTLPRQDRGVIAA